MKLVTAGRSFLDIDAYAGCIAYAELLRRQGQEAVAYSTAPLNESVPASLRGLDVQFATTCFVKEDDTFVIIDVSEPDFLEKTLVIDQVEEVIDHHLGFEKYWSEKKGVYVDIGFIGAACTLVYERWVESNEIDAMSASVARLLAAGILDNTLNLKASVSTIRDRSALEHLMEIAGVGSSWIAQYFTECEQQIYADISNALKSDTKIMEFKEFKKGPLAVGQLVVWDGTRALEKRHELVDAIRNVGSDWFINIVDIQEGQSHFITSDTDVRAWLQKILDTPIENAISSVGKLWLRKEINKADLDY